MQQRQAVVAKAASRYQRSSKKEKGSILSELVELTEYSRVYARRVLRQHGQRIKQGKHSLLADVRVHSSRSRAPYYDEQVRTALVKIWRVMDYICGKRLQPALAELVMVLERHNELRCDRLTREKLLQVSAATIDRLLRVERRKHELRSKARTKPGTLMKHQIPIRTFAEWDEQQPGFGEIDLVAHEGGLAAGDYCQTLDLTDVATTWTETIAVRNKAQSHGCSTHRPVNRRGLCSNRYRYEEQHHRIGPAVRAAALHSSETVRHRPEDLLLPESTVSFLPRS